MRAGPRCCGIAKSCGPGAPFGAEQALALGLASHVVPKGELAAKLAAVTAALLTKSAMNAVKVVGLLTAFIEAGCLGFAIGFFRTGRLIEQFPR